MKKSKKIILMVIPVLLLVVVLLSSNVFGFNNFDRGTIDTDVGKGTSTTTVGGAVDRIWGTVRLILQILAVAAIVFAGVRYMFASADQKADIKKSMVILVVGAVLVFGATFIVDFISNATSDITGGSGEVEDLM